MAEHLPGASFYRPVLSVQPFPVDGSVKTLGYDVIEWCEGYLLQPDGDAAGEPFRFSREQMNFVLWWYAIDAAGTFRYRRAILRRAKGWGKSPFLGALALAELCGPVRFGGWDAAGEPVAIRHPMRWVVIAGVSEAHHRSEVRPQARAPAPTSSGSRGTQLALFHVLQELLGDQIVPTRHQVDCLRLLAHILPERRRSEVPGQLHQLVASSELIREGELVLLVVGATGHAVISKRSEECVPDLGVVHEVGCARGALNEMSHPPVFQLGGVSLSLGRQSVGVGDVGVLVGRTDHLYERSF